MGELSPWHLLILAAVFVLLFGAKRLPDGARSLGRSLRIFKTEVKGLHDDETPGEAPPQGQLPAGAVQPAAPVASAAPPAVAAPPAAAPVAPAAGAVPPATPAAPAAPVSPTTDAGVQAPPVAEQHEAS